MTWTAPPWQGDESALVLIDWSWWLSRAFAVKGLEGMTATVIGMLTRGVLSSRPAHLAICLDSPGETKRHKIAHPTDETWRYKGHRPQKPREFYELAERCTQIAELHAIPILWAHEHEADDVIATAAARARAAGYRVWICSHDKDLCQLVESDPKSGILTGTWDNFEGTFRGPAEVHAEFGVHPHQMADYLAIHGDSSDGIPGVDGLGKKAAAEILGAWGTLEDALCAAPWPAEQYALAERHLTLLARRIKAESDAGVWESLIKEREHVKHVKQLASLHRKLLDGAPMARFSRLLTALDCDVPIRIPWEQLPVGGFEPELRTRLHEIGFTRLAEQVPTYRKRAPWVIPYEDNWAAE